MKSFKLMGVCLMLAVLFFAGNAYSTFNQGINGTVCRAANLQQSFDLAWNHARVYNPSEVGRWVVCPVPKSKDYILDNASYNDYIYSSGLYVYVWFDTGSEGETVTCIVRSMSVLSDDTSALKTQVLNISTTNTRPTYAGASVGMGDWSDSDPVTVTCALEPHTGINGVLLSPNHHEPE